MRRVVVAGGSIAGVTAAAELRRQGYDGELTVLERDPAAPYRRPEVSKSFLAAPPGPSKLGLAPDLDVRTVRTTIEGIDVERRAIATTGGPVEYDGLVVATGSRARTVAGWSDLDGVHTLRDHQDSERLRDRFLAATAVTVIGGGFIGLEVAAKAAALGKRVVVVEAASMPLERVAAPEFGRHVTAALERRGVEFRCAHAVVKIERAGADTVVHLASGDELVSDLVVLAVGSEPVVDWLTESGLDVSAGVVCDATCAIEGLDDAVAAGDVAQWLNPLYGARMRIEHWTNAIEQGTYAARRLLGRHDPAGFVSVPYFWSTQGDLKVESSGSTLAYDECRVTAVEGDRIVVTYGLAGRLVAVAGVGATLAVMKAKKLIAAEASIDDAAVAETCR